VNAEETVPRRIRIVDDVAPAGDDRVVASRTAAEKDVEPRRSPIARMQRLMNGAQPVRGEPRVHLLDLLPEVPAEERYDAEGDLQDRRERGREAVAFALSEGVLIDGLHRSKTMAQVSHVSRARRNR